MKAKHEAIFSVWIDTVSGDLITHGTAAGRGYTREAAWECVKAVKASPDNVRQIRVLRGCSLVWRTSRVGNGWTK